MPCSDALIKKVETITADKTVKQALDQMKKKKVTFLPVLDKETKAVLGGISISTILNELLPTHVNTGQGGPLSNVRIPATPGMAKRLPKVLQAGVSEVMDRSCEVLHEDDALDQAIRSLSEAGGQVIITTPDNQSFVGVITTGSVLEAIEKKA